MSLELIKVGLKDIKVNATIGLLKEEKILSNNFLVNVEVSFIKNKVIDDNSLNYSVNYVELNEIVKEAFKCNALLMETVAEIIISRIKISYSFLKDINLKISKLNPPIDSEMHSSFVDYHVSL